MGYSPWGCKESILGFVMGFVMGSLSLCWKMFSLQPLFLSDVFAGNNSGLTGVLSLHLHFGCHCFLVPVTSVRRVEIMAH